VASLKSIRNIPVGFSTSFKLLLDPGLFFDLISAQLHAR